MKPLIAAAAFAALGAGTAWADRLPTPEEQTAIEGALKTAGYTSWGKVDFDDGHWDVDNAIGPDGKRYDVDLAPGDLKIIKSEIDLD
jgi:hypothetical protein